MRPTAHHRNESRPRRKPVRRTSLRATLRPTTPRPRSDGWSSGAQESETGDGQCHLVLSTSPNVLRSVTVLSGVSAANWRGEREHEAKQPGTSRTGDDDRDGGPDGHRRVHPDDARRIDDHDHPDELDVDDEHHVDQHDLDDQHHVDQHDLDDEHDVDQHHDHRGAAGSRRRARLAAGNNHTCALKSTGVVRCWGDNSTGQLGNGTTTASLTPVTVTGLPAGIVSIAAGDNQTCALTAAGGVKCWGNNANGQLGDGTTTQRNAPVDVVGLGSGVAHDRRRRQPHLRRTRCGRHQVLGLGQLGPARQRNADRQLRRAPGRPRVARRRRRGRDLRRLPPHLRHPDQRLHPLLGPQHRGPARQRRQRGTGPLRHPAHRPGQRHHGCRRWRHPHVRGPVGCSEVHRSQQRRPARQRLDHEVQRAGHGHRTDGDRRASQPAAATPARSAPLAPSSVGGSTRRASSASTTTPSTTRPHHWRSADSGPVRHS